MAPPAAVAVLATPSRLHHFRRLAATGTVPSSAIANVTSTAPNAWAQLLAQQLLCTLWRLHGCGVLPSLAPPPPAGATGATGAAAAAAASAAAAAAASTPPIVPQDGLFLLSAAGVAPVTAAAATSEVPPAQARAASSEAAAAGGGGGRGGGGRGGGGLPMGRATGASMPTFAMASANTRGTQRVKAQGALARTTGGVPTTGQLPFLAAIIGGRSDGSGPPSSGLFYSKSSPGFF